MKEKDVFDLLMNSSPGDYTYDDEDGLYFYKSDINLRLQIIREDEETPYNAKWASKFADKKATVSLVRIYYLATPIKKIYCVWVDGCRHLIPQPRLGEEDIIDAFEYKIGSILNHHRPFQGFDQALQRAGIKVQED